MAQKVKDNTVNETPKTPEVPETPETPNMPEGKAAPQKDTATAPATLNDDTKIMVKALVPSVFYTCQKTFESFSWFEVGDTQEMTYLQLKMMKAKHPRYFTEKWLLPCNEAALKKLNLKDTFATKVSRAEIQKLYGTDVKAVEELLSGLSEDAKTELAQKVTKAVKAGDITHVKIIRLLEKQLGVELMQFI